MGYTRQLGQLAYLITYDGSGNITVPASLTQGSVTSSMLKADSSGKLVAAVAGTDFVAPAGLSAYVPTSRTITINGTAYDLSADRSWSIVSGVSSFNTRTGAITLLDTDVTGALGYTPVTNARTITINGTTYDLSANRSWSIVAGISSFNTRTGDITLLDTDVTGALGYTPVTNARTITINGTTYDLSANRTWVVDASSVTTRVIQKFTSTSNQTAFTITGGYTVGMVDVFLNGIKLDNAVDFTATDGANVVLAVGAAAGDIVEVYKYGGQFIANNTLRQSTLFTATAGQTTFTVNYSVGFVDVFYNGSKLDSSEFTATNGTSIILGTACVLNDKVEVIAYNYTVGAFTGVGGSGTAGYHAKWTASGTLNNSLIYDNGTSVGIGTSTPDNTYQGLTLYGTNPSVRLKGTSISSWNWIEFVTSAGVNNFSMGVNQSATIFAIKAGAGLDNPHFTINSGGQVCVNTTGGTSGGVQHPFIVKGISITNQISWFEAASNDSAIYIDNDGSSPAIGVSYRTSAGYLPLTFKTSGLERLRINTDGPVDFGSQSDFTRIGNDSGGTYIEKMASPTEGKRKIRMQAGNSASTQYSQFIIDGSNQTMEFRTNNTNRFFINSGGQINTPYQPAFFAIGLPADLYANYGGGPITFSSAPTNRGSHWNGSRFTAPVAGIYYMAFESMYSHRGGDITFRVMKNGASVSYSNPHTLDNGGFYPPWSQSTTTWVGTLAAGDYIEFTFASSNNGSTFIYAGGLYTKVYGYMIG